MCSNTEKLVLYCLNDQNFKYVKFKTISEVLQEMWEK